MTGPLDHDRARRAAAVLDDPAVVPLPAEVGTEILRCQVGSGLHGVTIAGQDDRDEMGICLERPEYVIGLGRPMTGDRPELFQQWQHRTQPEGVRSGPGDLDLTVYGLRKWARLAAAGNPTVLLPLFAPAEQLVITTPIGHHLRDRAAGLFLTRAVADRYIGYLGNQRDQMLGLRPGKRHTNRPELIDQFGFDTKSAYHMVRIGVQGVELLYTGRVRLPMTSAWREWLLSLRRGEISKTEALETAENLQRQIETLRDIPGVLPAGPDWRAINQFLFTAYTEEWGLCPVPVNA